MQDRARKLKRLVSVQRQIEQMAEMDLADTNRVRAQIADSMDALVDAMNSLNPTHYGFSRLYALQLGNLKSKDQQLVGRSRLQEQKLLAERAKADRLEDHMRDAVAAGQRDADDEAGYDILDSFMAQASGKFRRS